MPEIDAELDYQHPSPEQKSWVGRLLWAVLSNRLIVALAVGGVILAGLAVAPFDWDLGPLPRDRVPVDAIPDLGENQQIVFTDWPGHSPQDVEDQITLPLTTSLLALKDVQTIRSTSMYGFSSVYVIFADGADFYESRTRLLEKLSSLPAGTLPPGVQSRLGPDATALGQIFWYTLEGRDEQGNPTGGWDLMERRSVQDYQVRYDLSAVGGVAEVASVGGHVREFHVELNPDAMRAYDVTLPQVYDAIRSANLDVSARTVEINRVEYFVRGVGLLRSEDDLAQAVVKPGQGAAPVLLEQVGTVTLGPARRRGALDKDGVEAVGGVVVARYGANPMRVISSVKQRIGQIQPALPRKVLLDRRNVDDATIRAYALQHGFEPFAEDGTVNQPAWLEHVATTAPPDHPPWLTVSQLTIVPFYDRTELIDETLGTLESALSQQVLITLIVVVLMVMHLRSSGLIGLMLPLAVLMCFVAMRLAGVDANIVALSGIAIAIGTIVDMGIVLCENILRHMEAAPPGTPRKLIVHRATSEVGSAVMTAVATTVVSFLPVFAMVGREGKLFRPLAFTKTFVLISAVVIALCVLPPLAMAIFRQPGRRAGWWRRARRIGSTALNVATVVAVGVWLTGLWEPLGPARGLTRNLVFVAGLVGGLIGLFKLFQWGYPAILAWCLRHKLLFLSVPTALLIFAVTIWLGWPTVSKPIEASAEAVGAGDRYRASNLHQAGSRALPGLDREFMPRLDEGSFLWMPTISVHGSIGEALDVLSHQDRAIRSVPEVETVVGKIGRADSPLDPAPVSMIETVILYKSEYAVDAEGNRVRQWRDHIRTPKDIWDEIVAAADYPGSTSAPPLQPIETRLVMLQTGMTARMGVKVYGENLRDLDAAAVAIQKSLEQVDAIDPATVNADRVVGKPYLVIDTQSQRAKRRRQLHGVNAADVLRAVEATIGGKVITHTIDGRERTAVRVQYQRELRDDIEAIERILVPTPSGAQVPLEELVEVRYVAGPQMIKSENTLKVAYVTFGGREGLADTEVVAAAQEHLDRQRDTGELPLPAGVRYELAGEFRLAERANQRLTFILPIALGVIFVLLFLQFRSVTNAGIIFIGIAVAFSGGFGLLWLYGRSWFLDAEILGANLRDVFQVGPVSLSVAVWVGFLALFGIATDDGVVMGTYLDQSFRRRRPDSIDEIRKAVVMAGSRRVRACLMTTATTILALLPVLTSTGRGSDIMVPMAIPSFGGMAIEVLTMLIVPVLYSLLQETRWALRNRRENPPADASASPPRQAT